MAGDWKQVDVDFTLSLNCRTGKFFFCKDLIESASDYINEVLYWRLAFDQRPEGVLARILGRLAADEVRVRRSVPFSNILAPSVRRPRPVIFTDPREVIFHHLKSSDCVIVHDVGPITHPELYEKNVDVTYQTVFKKISSVKPSLIFVTESARREFVGLFGDDFPAMDVISPPLRQSIADGPAEPLASVQKPYILTVGAIGTRKNQSRAIRAFEQTGLAARGYSYVLCGGPEPGFDEVASVADRTAGVVRTGYVSDANLRWLYQNAAGFVLPSLLEGFGLPAAEAIAYDLVPLVTMGGALHEVTGDEAILVDPTDVGMISSAISKLVELTDHERSVRLRSLRESAARFTAEAAKATWTNVLTRLVMKGKSGSYHIPHRAGT